MSKRYQSPHEHADGIEPEWNPRVSPGKVSLTAQLRRAPVQARGEGEIAGDPGAIRDTAAAGVSGGGGALPHLDPIQRSFGAHDVSGVKAHVGGQAAAASEQIGAVAYATGDSVAFRDRPDLHTAAHEAAHVVQQRAGVQLAGGVGQSGDAYERHADAVADRVVRGESAQDLLDAPAGAGPGPGGAGGDGGFAATVQRMEFRARPGQGFGQAGAVVQMNTGTPASSSGGSNISLAGSRTGTNPEDRSTSNASGGAVAGRTGQPAPRSDAEIEDEILRAIAPDALRPMADGKGVAGTTKVSPDVALKLLENMGKGEPPFKPELGKGGCSWFVSEGNPYVGSIVGADKSVGIPVEIARGESPVIFNEAVLLEIHESKMEAARVEAEARYRQHNNIPEGQELNSKGRKSVARLADRVAESWMWDEVGERVRNSGSKVGEVVLEGSKFSKGGNGKFLVVADAAKITIRGGVPAMVGALEGAGLAADATLTQAAEALAKQKQWTGRVIKTFHYGGRVLLVVAVAADSYKIYTAENKLKAVVEVAGGWAGAVAAGAAFSAVFAPADAAGPWAWAAHGVGLLVSGAVGYWAGSEVTRYVYELVEDPGQ